MRTQPDRSSAVPERGNAVLFSKTESKSNTETGTTVTAVTARAASRKRPTARGSRNVLIEVCRSVKASGLPPINEGLKDILVGQIGILLRGGWPTEEVQRAAIDLALAWDEKRGHSRLAHLAARCRLMDEQKRVEQHKEFLLSEQQAAAGLDPKLARRNPSLHDFSQDPDAPKNVCRFCTGPIGVHVRKRVDVA